MSQTPLFTILFVVGLSVCLAAGPRNRIALCCALAFPIGLAVMVPVTLLMLSLGVGYTPVTAGLAAAAVIAGSGAVIARRGGPDRRGWTVIGVWTAAFIAVSLPLAHVNVSILSFDSHSIVMLGRVLAEDGRFAPGVVEQLAGWGVFEVVAQSGVRFTTVSYLYGLSPMLGLSAVPLFGLILWHGLGALGVPAAQRGRMVVLVTAAVFTVYLLTFHVIFIHTNFGSGVYLFVFCSLWWLAEIEDDTTSVPVVFLALTAFALHRIENPIVCVVFLSLTVLGTRLPARTVLPALGLHTAAIAGWYLLLSTEIPPTSQFLTPNKCYLTIGVTVGFAAWAALSAWPRLRVLDVINRRAPQIAAAACVLGLIAAFAIKPGHMLTSLGAWSLNLMVSPFWVLTWWAMLLLAILGRWAPAPARRDVFVYGIPLYLGLILLLASGRPPYRYGMGDSANRMSLHLVQLAFFYFGLKFIPLLSSSARYSASGSTTSGPSSGVSATT